MEPRSLRQIEFPLYVDGCRLEYDAAARWLRIESAAIYREFVVRDRVLYSGAFGETDRPGVPASGLLIETFRFPFLDNHPRDEPSLRVQSSGETDVYAAGSEPREETQIIIEQSAGPYELRFVIAVIPGLPFMRSQLFVRGPAWTPRDTTGVVDRNLAFASMESDPERRPALPRPPEDTVDAFPHGIRHARLSKHVLFDDTDRHDYLVESTACDLYGNDHPHAGNIFLVQDRAVNASFLLIKDGPTIHSTLYREHEEFFWRDNEACGIRGSGIDPASLSPHSFAQSYGAILGVGDHAPDLLRTYFAVTGPRADRRTFVLANTWGDRNRDASLNEAFVRQEIDVAAELGIDYIQLDDGWQAGVTKNSGLQTGGVWEGYYALRDDFWAVNQEKFPNGLEPLVAYAGERSVRLGLWFSPDSSGSFANWRRDAEVLLDFYHTFGIDQFKLDGIKLRDKEGERNLLLLLEMLERESDGSIDYCMDVTAEVRLGYLYERRHGKIYLENRYTDWGNYFPYRTLRNLWMLARFFPTRRFQIELLNNRRNPAVYGDDPHAPSRYAMDYLFAIAMTATPLVFMELSHLPGEARAELAPILAVHQTIRDRLAECTVVPIGARPDGFAYTGFHCVHPDSGGFLILFRDLAEADEYTFGLSEPILADREISMLYESAPWSLSRVGENEIRVSVRQQRSVLVADY